MTTAKILSVVALYRARFEKEGIPKIRMNPDTCPRSKDTGGKREMLAHAHYLLDGIAKYAQDPEKVGKTGRHLGSAQMLLWCAGWYTLTELMDHNRPD
ncbi:MAG: hypothetical protein RLZZ347_30 [Candidatus Parcubacteria bacterium]|jgi:hypothetical protein